MNTLPSPAPAPAAPQQQPNAGIATGNPQPLPMQQSRPQPPQFDLSKFPDLATALRAMKVMQDEKNKQVQQGLQAGAQAQQPSVVEQLNQSLQRLVGEKQAQTRQASGLSQLFAAAQRGEGGGGVDQLPSNLGDGYAGGGIVAFNGEEDSQLVQDWTEYARKLDAEKGAAAAEENRINEVARAAAQQRALEEAQAKDADTAASLLGYAFSPASKYRDADYVKQNLRESRNYDHETKRGIAALAARPYQEVDDRPKRPSLAGTAGIGKPTAEDVRKHQVGDAGEGPWASQYTGTQLTPQGLATLKSDATKSAEAKHLLDLYLAKFPEATGNALAVSAQAQPGSTPRTGTPDDTDFMQKYKEILLKQAQADPVAAQNRAAAYERDTVGAQPILDEQRKRAMDLQALQEQQKGLRNPTYEFLRGIAESKPGWGGAGMQLLGGANRFADARKNWGAADVSNQESINKLLDAVGTAQINANTGVAKAGALGHSDATRLLGTALSSGATLAGVEESAAQRAAAARYAADERLQAMRERMAKASSESQAAKVAEIRAQAQETVATMRDLTTEIDKIDPAMAMADKTIAARRAKLQAELDMWRTHLATLHGVKAGPSAAPTDAAKPTMKYNPQTGKLEAI